MNVITTAKKIGRNVDIKWLFLCLCVSLIFALSFSAVSWAIIKFTVSRFMHLMACVLSACCKTPFCFLPDEPAICCRVTSISLSLSHTHTHTHTHTPHAPQHLCEILITCLMNLTSGDYCLNKAALEQRVHSISKFWRNKAIDFKST